VYILKWASGRVSPCTSETLPSHDASLQNDSMKSIFPLLLLIFASSAFAQDIYVSTSGSDSNPGTLSQPFLTIQKANSVAAAGDTVHVLPGTYTISGGAGVGFTLSASGSSGNRITYISDTAWGAQIVLNGGNNTSDPNVGIAVTGSWVDVVGFDITEGASGAYRAALVNTAGSNVRFIHNRVHDLQHSTVILNCLTWGGMGIGSFPGAGTTDILENYVYNIGDYTNLTCVFVHGIYDNSAGQIKNNIVFRNSGFGLNINRSGIDIVNNTIFQQAAGGIFIDNSGGTWNAHHVNNNLIFNVGIGSSHQNGISWQYTNDTPSDSSYIDNLVFQSSGTQGNNFAQGSNTTPHTGDVQTNPLFINYTGQPGNYNLCIGSGNPYGCTGASPGVGAGTTAGAPATDFNGNTRTPPIWIGAYQGGGTATAPGAPTGLTATIK
jgi:hypothetical protein